MAHADGEALFALLTDDFVGTVSDGMPHGVGGEHHGPADMITGVWARIASEYDMHVDPHDYLPVDDERVVVLGRYWGPARDGKSAVDAAFAHIITTRGTGSRRCNRSRTRPDGASGQRADAPTDQHRIRPPDR
jgi:hypothetical protein